MSNFALAKKKINLEKRLPLIFTNPEITNLVISGLVKVRGSRCNLLPDTKILRLESTYAKTTQSSQNFSPVHRAKEEWIQQLGLWRPASATIHYSPARTRGIASLALNNFKPFCLGHVHTSVFSNLSSQKHKTFVLKLSRFQSGLIRFRIFLDVFDVHCTFPNGICAIF